MCSLWPEQGTWQPDATRAIITDAYVPAGSSTVTVDAVALFRVGDAVVIQRAATDAWIRFMNMHALERDGKRQTWLKAGTVLTHDRTIKSIEGNRITFDVPLSDSFDAAYLNPPGASVAKYTFPGRIEQVGVESLRVTVPAQDKPISEAQYTLLSMNAVMDGWVRDIVSVDTQNSTTFGSTVRRVTIDRRGHPAHAAVYRVGGARGCRDVRHADSARSIERDWRRRVARRDAGRRHRSERRPQFQEHDRGHRPHQRWATGLLVDSSEFTGGSDRRPNIAFSNREYAGSGHGWSVGWAVAWNVKAEVLLDSAAAGREELVHRVHRPVHADPVARAIDSHSREPVRNARVSGRARDTSEPLSCAVARSARRAGPAKHRAVIAITIAGSVSTCCVK